MTRQHKVMIHGLTALALMLALAPTGWARGDRDGAARDARQLARLDRITNHQIQVEARQEKAKTKAANTAPTTEKTAPTAKNGK